MAKIRVKNFGPIKEGFTAPDSDGWIDIKKVTVFIGNQATGKSTLAKLISTFTWIEKALTRGDYPPDHFQDIKVILTYLSYQNIDSYMGGLVRLQSNLFEPASPQLPSEIEYRGESYCISIKGFKVNIEKSTSEKYHLPQIVYMPAERNLLNFTHEYRRVRRMPETLIDLQIEFRNITNEINGTLQLPINDLELIYSKTYESLMVKGQDYQIQILDASSGIQSVVPLYLISRFYANSVKAASATREPMNSEELERFKQDIATIHNNMDLTDEQRRAALSVVASKYKKTAFVNIVEEPEQNLFPTSQWDILKSLLEFNNMSEGNKLIMTTHSPYVISYLTLAVKAFDVYKLINEKGKTDLLPEISKIVPPDSILDPNDLAIYEIDRMGNVIKLGDYEGLPSEDNYLNQMLEKSNILFSNLLDIEDKCL